MNNKENNFADMFAEMKSTGIFDNATSNNSQDNTVWLLLLGMFMLMGNPTGNSHEAYLQGKVDAYEKVIRRLF